MFEHQGRLYAITCGNVSNSIRNAARHNSETPEKTAACSADWTHEPLPNSRVSASANCGKSRLPYAARNARSHPCWISSRRADSSAWGKDIWIAVFMVHLMISVFRRASASATIRPCTAMLSIISSGMRSSATVTALGLTAFRSKTAASMAAASASRSRATFS